MKIESSSSTQFFQLIRSLKWPIGITIFAVILALAETITGLVIPLVTKNLVDSLTTAIFDWRLITLLFVVFILQAIAGGVSYFAKDYHKKSCSSLFQGRTAFCYFFNVMVTSPLPSEALITAYAPLTKVICGGT